MSNWKNFDNPKIPPSVYPFWSYNNTWSYGPVPLEKKVYAGSNNLNYYWTWLERQKSVNPQYNMLTQQGGINNNTIRYINDNLYRNVPDLRSETQSVKTQLNEYYKQLEKYNLTPSDLHRDKI